VALKIIEIFVGIDKSMMNNFCYWLDSKFKIEFELEFMVDKQSEIDLNF
jgi:hypothetical protein